MSHEPVMLAEVLEALSPVDGGVYVDGTFGAGGYSAAILEAADCTVIGIDRDLDAVDRAAALKEKYGERLVFIRGAFGDVRALLQEHGYDAVDGFVLDLGVSSFQLDEAERGFSFRFDGPLDMRMDRAGGEMAADIVNTYDEKPLADLIYRYGEERKSRQIARRIVEQRAEKPFLTTNDLAALLRDVVPKSPKDKSDPATRTFQALRIAVNDELGQLENALATSIDILRADGRLVVVSFHSLEDSAVKRFMREGAGLEDTVSRHMPATGDEKFYPFILPKKSAVKPSSEEIARNPRSRSARLRLAVKVGGSHA